MFCLAVVYASLALKMQKMTKIGIKKSLTDASPAWKYFGLYNQGCQFYTFENEYVRDFVRRSGKDGRVCAFNRNFGSQQSDEKILPIGKHVNIENDEIAAVVDKYLEYITIKQKKYQKLFIVKETDCRKIDKKEIVEFFIERFDDLEVRKALRKIKKDYFLISFNFISLYLSAEADENSTWLAIETSLPLKKYLSDAVCALFNSG